MRKQAGSILATVALLAAGCGHDLRSGPYLLSQGEPATVDSCDLLAGTSPIKAQVTSLGDEVRVEFEPPNVGALVQMIGLFKQPENGKRDEFSVDGSLGDVTARVRGVECLVRFGQLHLDAETSRTDDLFWGTLEMTLNLVPDQEPACPLRCELSVPYTAELMEE